MTNGLTGLQMLLDALCAKGLIGIYSLEGLEILNPFGIYANMLGFFLFGAWLHTAGTFKNSLTAQRLLGLLLSAAGLLGMWGVNGTPAKIRPGTASFLSRATVTFRWFFLPQAFSSPAAA